MRTLLASILLAAAVLGTACGGGGAGKIMADTPIVEYVAPDTDELAGIEEAEEPDEEDAEGEPEEGTPPAPAPAPK